MEQFNIILIFVSMIAGVPLLYLLLVWLIKVYFRIMEKIANILLR